MARDDLEVYVEERSKRDSEFPKLVAAAENRQAIARGLAARREKVHLSQTQVAARMSTSASVVSRIESGADVLFSTLQKYAAALDLNLMVSLSDSKKSSQKREIPTVGVRAARNKASSRRSSGDSAARRKTG